MNNEAETFAQRLKRLRKAHGYSQDTFAEKIGTTRRIISYYESESKYPPAKQLIGIAKAFEISVDELLGVEEIRQDKRSIDSKFWPKWEQLTSDDKKAVTKIVDSFIEKNKLLSGK